MGHRFGGAAPARRDSRSATMKAPASESHPLAAGHSAAAPCSLPASYELCRQIARRSASSFYYSFLLLPRAKRDAMCALYAFLRRTDDLSDGPSAADERRQPLLAWRHSLA